jgi:hypothetical protein
MVRGERSSQPGLGSHDNLFKGESCKRNFKEQCGMTRLNKLRGTDEDFAWMKQSAEIPLMDVGLDSFSLPDAGNPVPIRR